MLQICPLNFLTEYVCDVMSNIILVVWNNVLSCWLNYMCVSPSTITTFVRKNTSLNVIAKTNFRAILISLMFLCKRTSYLLFQSYFSICFYKERSHRMPLLRQLVRGGVELENTSCIYSLQPFSRTSNMLHYRSWWESNVWLPSGLCIMHDVFFKRV